MLHLRRIRKSNNNQQAHTKSAILDVNLNESQFIFGTNKKKVQMQKCVQKGYTEKRKGDRKNLVLQ